MSEPYPGLLPIGAFTLEVFPGVPTLALEGEGSIRITLAALDPENADGDKPSTLRILRKVFDEDEDNLVSYSDDEDDDEDDEEEDSEEEKPTKKSSKKAVKDEEELEDAEDSEDDEDEDEDEEFEISKTVVCTLSPKTSYQQTLDIVINAAEDVIFEVSGSYPIHLTGNYILNPLDEEDSDEEDYYEDDSEGDYDLSPDEDELDFSNRIQEVTQSDSEEEAPKKTEPKQKNKKRAVEETPAVETKTKKQKKAEKAEDKKVAFTKELEQGPTGSTSSPAAKKGPVTKKLAGGVTIEDRKTGDGPTAQPGDKVSVRYIGKLLNGSTFDSNTKGKPFSFKLGAGEVIKGWDVGVAGMSVKGERRIVIPASSAYGKKALPGIPANSTLTFDVKLVGIK